MIEVEDVKRNENLTFCCQSLATEWMIFQAEIGHLIVMHINVCSFGTLFLSWIFRREQGLTNNSFMWIPLAIRDVNLALTSSFLQSTVVL